MKNSNTKNQLFLQAVKGIDDGDIIGLEQMIVKYPGLIRERLLTAENGYFKDPFLLWFIADNPIRIDKLPSNITAITSLLTNAVKVNSTGNAQQQLDYALGLVATGRIPRECGVQIAMMDVLIDAGAHPGGGMGAIAHKNIKAANHLINRGGKLTFPAAVCLGRTEDIERLGTTATPGEKFTALTTAAFFGNVEMVKMLLSMGTEANGYPVKDNGFHSHATALHQAVYSGSLDTVKLLVKAGANLNATDKIYNGTPLGWAMYMQTEESYTVVEKKRFVGIEKYLKALK